jgi:hypothetical protein
MDHLCVHLQPWDADSIRGHLQKHGVTLNCRAILRYGGKSEQQIMAERPRRAVYKMVI